MLPENLALSRLAYLPAEKARAFKQEKWKSRVGDFDDHARILDYWVRRREGLSEREWTDFYGLVTRLLMRTRLGVEYGDPALRLDLIHTFFNEKILANALTSAAGPLENVHALHGYLKNFARDIARREDAYVPLGDHQDPDDRGDGGECDDGSGVDQALSLGQRLREAGIDPAAAAASADDFVGSLDALEFAYLSENACADEDAREPVSSIAARLRASSYHYRAKQLGIARSKGETFAGYEQTKIGRWMRSLGAVLVPDWQEEIRILLIVLCGRVLSMAGRRP